MNSKLHLQDIKILELEKNYCEKIKYICINKKYFIIERNNKKMNSSCKDCRKELCRQTDRNCLKINLVTEDYKYILDTDNLCDFMCYYDLFEITDKKELIKLHTNKQIKRFLLTEKR